MAGLEFVPPPSEGDEQKKVQAAMAAFQEGIASEEMSAEEMLAQFGKAPAEAIAAVAKVENQIPGRPDLDDVEITENDKTKFFEFVLAQQQYTDTFPLFGGKAQVELRVRTAAEAEEATNAANESVKAIHMVTAVDYQNALSKHHLAFAVVSVTTPKWKKVTLGSLKERVKILMDFPTPLYTALLVVTNQFNRKAEKLGLLSTMPNFWQPASGT